MNQHVVVYQGYEAALSDHYAAVRARLGGVRPADAAPVYFLPAPTERHDVIDIVPDQRGVELVMPIGAEAEIAAARRALAMFARLRQEKPGTNSVRHLQVAVAAGFKVDLWAILGRSKRQGPTRIRQIAMMLAHCCCKGSRADAARRFDRNHATAMHAEKKFAAFLHGATSQVGELR